MQTYYVGQHVIVCLDASHWIEGLEILDKNRMWIQGMVIGWIDNNTPGSEEYYVCFQTCRWVGGVSHLVLVIYWFHDEEMIHGSNMGAGRGDDIFKV
eukprot:1517244-Ditylum_brightwellii.AAC.1